MNVFAVLAGQQIFSSCTALMAYSGAPTLVRRLLTFTNGRSCSRFSTAIAEAAAATEQPAAPHQLATYLDSVLLQSGAGAALLKAHPELQGRLMLSGAEAAVSTLASVGASPAQCAAMIRANPRYLLDLDANKFRAVIAGERAFPGSVLSRLVKMEVQHFEVTADGSLHPQEPGCPGREQLPPLFLATTAVLERVFARAEGSSDVGAMAAKMPLALAPASGSTQQFQRWVDAWLEVGRPAEV